MGWGLPAHLQSFFLTHPSPLAQRDSGPSRFPEERKTKEEEGEGKGLRETSSNFSRREKPYSGRKNTRVELVTKQPAAIWYSLTHRQGIKLPRCPPRAQPGECRAGRACRAWGQGTPAVHSHREGLRLPAGSRAPGCGSLPSVSSGG